MSTTLLGMPFNIFKIFLIVSKTSIMSVMFNLPIYFYYSAIFTNQVYRFPVLLYRTKELQVALFKN